MVKAEAAELAPSGDPCPPSYSSSFLLFSTLEENSVFVAMFLFNYFLAMLGR